MPKVLISPNQAMLTANHDCKEILWSFVWREGMPLISGTKIKCDCGNRYYLGKSLLRNWKWFEATIT